MIAGNTCEFMYGCTVTEVDWMFKRSHFFLPSKVSSVSDCKIWLECKLLSAFTLRFLFLLIRSKTATVNGGQTRDDVVCLGPGGVPAEVFSDEFQTMALNHVKPKTMPNLVPTTYEAATAYLREEHKKPRGKRNLLREMIPSGLPQDRKACFVVYSMKTTFPLFSGE
jgi:hypothetical protein